MGRDNMSKVFGDIYASGRWGILSGNGSGPIFSKEYIDFVRNYIDENNITSVVDLGCGDFRLSREILKDNDGISYIGVDCFPTINILLSRIYAEDPNINFACYDFLEKKEDIPSCDLMIIKEVFQHWPSKYICEFMDYIIFSGKVKHLIVANSVWQSKNGEIKEIGGHQALSAKSPPLNKYGLKVAHKYAYIEISVMER